ncbi:hypothetical protein AAZX31_02G171100 [Glycine max]
MDSLKGSQIALVRKEDCVPYSIYFEGLKGSKLTLGITLTHHCQLNTICMPNMVHSYKF